MQRRSSDDLRMRGDAKSLTNRGTEEMRRFQEEREQMKAQEEAKREERLLEQRRRETPKMTPMSEEADWKITLQNLNFTW